MKFQAEYLDGHKVTVEAKNLDEAYEIAGRCVDSILMAVWPEGITYCEFVLQDAE